MIQQGGRLENVPKRTKYGFTFQRKFPRDKLRSASWRILRYLRAMEEGWRYLEDNITTAMNKSIPKSNRNEGPHNRSNRPMWMNNTGTALVKVKSKNEAYKCYRSTMDVKDYEKYAKARNQARWECHKAKKIFERTLAKEAKRNPKAIFSYVNSKLKTKTGIADLHIETGKATTDSEKA